MESDYVERPKAAAADSDSESCSEEDDYIDDLPVTLKSRTGPRPSVSAESFGSWNKKEAFKARCIPKTPE